MLRQPTHLAGLLSVVLLSAGLAAPITLADDLVETEQAVEQPQPTDAQSDQPDSVKDQSLEKPEKEAKEDMIEVRISMPDGRTIIRYEPARKTSARHASISTGVVSRILPDGSRISYGTGGVVGGSNASSVRSGGGGSSGGGGGSGRSGGGGSSGGGGGGGVSSGVATISRGGGLDSADIESESTSQALGEGDDSSSNAVDDDLSGGSAVDTFVGSYASNNSDSSTDSSEANADSTDTRSVPTVGNPEYTDDGAIGGQRAEFHDAGIGAAVIGNTVYFIGVELVQADQPFEVNTGTRIGADSAILLDSRPSGGGDLLNDWNTAASPIQLDFESNTIVDLVMLSVPTDASNPIRIQRTWTVRIR